MFSLCSIISPYTISILTSTSLHHDILLSETLTFVHLKCKPPPDWDHTKLTSVPDHRKYWWLYHTCLWKTWLSSVDTGGQVLQEDPYHSSEGLKSSTAGLWCKIWKKQVQVWNSVFRESILLRTHKLIFLANCKITFKSDCLASSIYFAILSYYERKYGRFSVITLLLKSLFLIHKKYFPTEF